MVDQPLAGIGDRCDLLRHQGDESYGFAVREGQVEVLPAVEVAIERLARAPGGLGDVTHADRAHAAVDEQLGGGIEDVLGRQGRVLLPEPGHEALRNGTEVGRRT